MNLMFNVFQNDMVCLANHIVQSVPVGTGNGRRYKTDVNIEE
jgi:hypothetical protein